jgi:DNA-binding transcriptional MerR regulator
MGTHTDATQNYTIMEAATLSGLPESTLRYYETIGLLDPVKRDVSSKHRVYDEDDIELAISVACLSATGMSIQDMRTYLGNRTQGDGAAQEQIKLLETQKQRLGDEARYLQRRQQYIDVKIAYWQARSAGDASEAKVLSEKARRIALKQKLPKEK